MQTVDDGAIPERRRRRLPVLAPLAVLFLLLVVVARPQMVRVADYKPWCPFNVGVPEEAYRVEHFARTHNLPPPPGLKGNRTFEDRNKDLPFLARPLLEYDVYPQPPGRGRPPERVVISQLIPFASWYSPDHYTTFIDMFPPGCVPRPASLLP